MSDKPKPLKAIREKCLDCCCGNSNEVSLCPCGECPLFPFRFGHNPFYMTDEQRAASRERMQALNSSLTEEQRQAKASSLFRKKGDDEK